MIHRLRPIWFALLIVLFFGVLSVSHASDSIGVTSASVIRLQLQSIADEVFDQAKLDPKVRVALWVEGEGPRSLVENAFVETLQKRSFISVLSTGKTSDQTLHVFLLSADIKVRAVDEKYSERNIGIALEVRTVLGMEREVRLLGTFHRVAKDTAQVFPSLQLSVLPANEEESVMQRLLTPLIIISGAVLIVLLLFTVRS
ncbi:MAG: hypothetical protein ABSD46_09090 [Bacteroidota bacterium]